MSMMHARTIRKALTLVLESTFCINF